MESPIKRKNNILTLSKGKHIYRFVYQTGDEIALIKTFVEYVNRRDLNFDWFDASVLTNQIGNKLIVDDMKKMLENFRKNR